MRNWGRVAVICGGDSPERDVSLVSGKQVYEGLKALGANARLLEIEALNDLAPRLTEIDVAFIVLHGGYGENGTIQRFLDEHGIPYAGSGPEASALAMDKSGTKAVLARAGLPVPKAREYRNEPIEAFCDAVIDEFGLPMVFKPREQGSSIGVKKVESKAELVATAKRLLEQFGPFFVEEFIPGRELTVPVLLRDGVDEALPVIEVKLHTAFFSYESKYSDGTHDMVVPAPIGKELTRTVQEMCVRAHQALGCHGYSRADVMLAGDETPYFLELNTLPGMTPHSAFAKSAAVIGMSFTDLVKAMLETAFDRPAHAHAR